MQDGSLAFGRDDAGLEPGNGTGMADGAGLADGAEPPGLQASLEAILLVADEPVPEVALAQVLERPRDEVAAALSQLSASYTEQGRGFDLRKGAGKGGRSEEHKAE